MIICGDALTELKKLEDESVDLLCTDPPYGLNFMGKAWDKALPPIEVWKECLRVLKPGAFAFVMSIPRADCLSRMIISLEDAGFMVNFSPIFWAQAQGFPKAASISKMVDKRLGAEREVVGRYQLPNGQEWNLEQATNPDVDHVEPAFTASGVRTLSITAPATPQAKELDGSYSYNPKPAVEVIIVAQKPMTAKTYVDQALLWYEERQRVLCGLATELKRCYNIGDVEWEK